MFNLDTLPICPARNVRSIRRLGGSKGTKPDAPRLILIRTVNDFESALDEASRLRIHPTESQHLLIDSENIVRCVVDDNVAHSQVTPWNDMSLSIKQTVGKETSSEGGVHALGEAQMELVAQACAAWALKWGIPLRSVLAKELVRTWQYVSGVTTFSQITLASQTIQMQKCGYIDTPLTEADIEFDIDAMLTLGKKILKPGKLSWVNT